MLSFLTYVCGFIILFQLFNLQIVNGSEYRQNSNTKLSRETTIQATRGSILDRNGVPLVSSDMAFSLEMYKTKADDSSINHSISVMTQILESNGDSYVDNFPISINPFNYNFSSEEKLNEWKERYDIPLAASAEEAFYLFRDKYKIESEDVDEIRRALSIRYAITTKGYSSTKIREEKLIGQSYLQQIRHGELVSWKTIDTICSLLDCQVGDLVEYVKEPTVQEKG